MSVRGKRVLVTGATGGLGPHLCEALLAMGAEVIGAARRRTRLDDLRAGLGQHERLHVAECDVSASEGVAALFSSLEARAPLDAVVHAAGRFAYGELAEMEDETVHGLVSTNLISTTWILRESARRMAPRKAGSIVVIAAEGALSPSAGLAVYGATKAGSLHLATAMAEELSTTGVRVNAVLPGIVDTPGNRAAMPEADPSGWAQPGAIARTVLWLASDDSRGVTGAWLRVPGK